MRLFFAYIRYRIKIIAAFAVFSCVFVTILSLYSLPLTAVGYAALICLFLAIVFGLADYTRFKVKHEKITVASNAKTLPAPSDIIESDYQALIGTLLSEADGVFADYERRYSDTIEYYTLWAHQIKTPISAMRLRLQSEDTDENRELLCELQRIEQYVEMVLCYLRIDSDSSDLVIRDYPIDGIIRQAIRRFAPQFIRRKLALDYTECGFSVLTDEKWLLFVLEQIISNSIKYTKEGGIKIYSEPDNVLVIVDTGIGIAPEDLPRVFDKGFTGYNGRSDKRASGIGLYLCKRVLTKLGHGISVSSSLREGTQVRIELSTDDRASD